MKKLVFLSALAVAMCAYSQETAPTAESVKPKPTPQQRKEMFQRRMGGFVKDTRAQKGCVVIVDAQSEAKTEWMEATAKYFDEEVMITVKVEKGEFDLYDPVLKGEATVFVVKDEKLPMSLIAPEAKWAMVNVAKIASDKPAFYEARTKKELTRAISFVLGGADSQYPDSPTAAFLSANDLDRNMDPRLPVDVIDRFKKNMGKLGIAPYTTTTYRAACKAGWAPEPKDDNQRAIWEEYHSKPTEPIHIKFDPKKGM